MKAQFPILQTGYVYLDTAASAQKPRDVLEAIHAFYTTAYSNVHRGLHEWAEYSTIQFENARGIIAAHLNGDPQELIFTRGTTEAMNLLASTVPLKKGSRVITSILEHHSTFVPWQQAAARAGAEFHVIPLREGMLDMDAAERLIRDGCAVLAITQLSNVTGEAVDVARLASWVHEQQGIVVVDGAQGFCHLDTDVKALDIDAYCCSGHKAYGPTGVGALWVRSSLLASLPPFMFGGEMIDQVTISESTFASGIQRFEAGTPPIAQAVGFAAAVRWMRRHREARSQEQAAVAYCVAQLSDIPGITLIGPVQRRGAVTFTVAGVHAHDVSQFLDRAGVAVRAGQHCTQPLHEALGISASVRASFGLYNDVADVDACIAALRKVQEAFRV